MADSITTAILTEHLSYTPITIIDDIINSANDNLYTVCSSIEDYFNSSAPSALGFLPPPGQFAETDDDGKEIFDEKAIDEIQQGVHQLEMLLENGIDRAFDAFELYVFRNIFAVDNDLKDWVRLRHHEGLDLKREEERDNGITPQSLTRLRRQVRDTATLKAHLQADVAQNERIVEYLQSLLQPPVASTSPHPLAFLCTPSEASQAVKPAPETASFAIEQIKTLREMVTKLKGSSENLFDNDGDVRMGDGGMTKAKERDLYIERMTRRHLTNARGVSLTPSGSLKAGDGDLMEAKKEEADAQSLENLVEDLLEQDAGSS